jgi:hypothetical protein
MHKDKFTFNLFPEGKKPLRELGIDWLKIFLVLGYENVDLVQLTQVRPNGGIL